MDENYPTIGLGGYVILVAIVSALRVSPVINALSVRGAICIATDLYEEYVKVNGYGPENDFSIGIC